MEVQCDPRLASLYVRAITHYRDYERHAFIVPDSIPILYFGNLRDYRHSAIKIVTVGLNPSDAEFRESRFGAEVMSSLRPETLEPALSGYFSAKPYSAWFSAFETLLQPLGSSFYGREYAGEAPPWWMPQRNVALHTDLCSPLATTPTWTGLPKRAQDQLREWGVPLWRGLIAALEPDIVLMSVARSYLNALGDLQWRTLRTLGAATTPQQELKIAPFQSTHIVWGRAQVRPFFHLKYDQRPAVARAILAQPEFKSLQPR
jgi:hypothetical protein